MESTARKPRPLKRHRGEQNRGTSSEPRSHLPALRNEERGQGQAENSLLALPNKTGSALFRTSKITSHRTGTVTLHNQVGPGNLKQVRQRFLQITRNKVLQKRSWPGKCLRPPFPLPSTAIPPKIRGDYSAASEQNPDLLELLSVI